MTKYERNLLILFALALCVQPFNIPGKTTFLSLFIFILIFSYGVCGYLILNSDGKERYAMPILSGFALASGLFLFYITMGGQTDIEVAILLVLPVALLFTGLGIYRYKKRRQLEDFAPHRAIFIRSGVLLGFAGFFAFAPITFGPYRKVLLALNHENTSFHHNLMMFEYKQITDDADDDGDCDREIEYALKSNKEGLEWLGIDPSQQKDNADLNSIQGTYTNLYYGYRCKGTYFWEQHKYDKALENYKIADGYLTMFDMKFPYWLTQKSWSMVDMADCYKNLDDYPKADSLYLAALTNYKKIHKENDFNTARLIHNVAVSLYEQRMYASSNKLCLMENEILEKEEVNEKTKGELIDNFNLMQFNYTYLGEMPKVLSCLNRAFKLNEDQNSASYAITTFYYGIYLVNVEEYRKSISYFNSAIKKYQGLKTVNWNNIAESYRGLGYAYMGLADYKKARECFNKSLKINEKEVGSMNYVYARSLYALAQLNMLEGEYVEAEGQYHRVFDIDAAKYGQDNNILTTVLSGLARAEISLDKRDLAVAHVASAVRIAENIAPMNSLGVTGLIIDVAYVDYCTGFYKAAVSYYGRCLEINKNCQRTNGATSAAALNGLGLVETANNNGVKADSLFTESLRLHQAIYSEKHPLTANVRLNRAVLYIKQGRLVEAEADLNQAFNTNAQFFKSTHDVFGDLFVAKGDLAMKRKQGDLARDYYRKALGVYEGKFDSGHWKVVMVRGKLR